MDDHKSTGGISTGTGAAVARAKESDIVAAALAAVAADPEREARIADLCARYRNGTYYVKATTLAARIVDSEIIKR
jgi:hypothetical protein